MHKLWVLLVASGILQVSTDQSAKKNVYGPLCWGPGVWPHPEHCRLFTICHLKYEVKGQLYACPEETGFSTKHQRCMPEAKVAACRMAVFSEDKLSESTAIRFPVATGKPDTNLCYKNKTSAPFCLNDDELVVCGPREVYIATVSCAAQREWGSGHCDKLTRTCALDDAQDPAVGSDVTQPPSSSPYVTPSSLTPFPYVTSPPPSHPSPISMEELQNITAALLEEIASSNLTLFDKDLVNETTAIASTPDEGSLNSSTTETPLPTLPPTEQISCKVPGLQCHDNVTIIDCPDDLSEPNFVMSCANIIQTNDANATGYCNAENPTCVLMIQNFLLNLEISSFNFGEQSASSSEMEFAGIDEDYEGPELYDSDNLRESPDDFFGGLSWFRHVPKGARVLTSAEVHSNNRKEKSGRYLENEAVGSSHKFESHKFPKSASSKEKFSRVNSQRLGDLKESRDSLDFIPRIKHPKSIDARAESDDLDEFLAKCQQGGLYCFDNATLVACAGDQDSPTYAVQCYAEATSPNGRRLEAYCDQTRDSCVVNVMDAVGSDGEDTSRNDEVIEPLPVASVIHKRSASYLAPAVPLTWRAS